MHPDQTTPEGHRSHEPDSLDQGQAPPPAARPEQPQHPGADAPAPSTEVSTHAPEQPRTGEAGNAYMGRGLDDDLQTTPRVEGDTEGAGTTGDAG